MTELSPIYLLATRVLPARALLDGLLSELNPREIDSFDYEEAGRSLARVRTPSSSLAAIEASVDKLRPFLRGFLDKLTQLLPASDRDDSSKWCNFGEQLAGLLHPRLYLAPAASAQN